MRDVEWILNKVCQALAVCVCVDVQDADGAWFTPRSIAPPPPPPPLFRGCSTFRGNRPVARQRRGWHYTSGVHTVLVPRAAAACKPATMNACQTGSLVTVAGLVLECDASRTISTKRGERVPMAAVLVRVWVAGWLGGWLAGWLGGVVVGVLSGVTPTLCQQLGDHSTLFFRVSMWGKFASWVDNGTVRAGLSFACPPCFCGRCCVEVWMLVRCCAFSFCGDVCCFAFTWGCRCHISTAQFTLLPSSHTGDVVLIRAVRVSEYRGKRQGSTTAGSALRIVCRYALHTTTCHPSAP